MNRILFILCFILLRGHGHSEEIPIALVIPSYNNTDWYMNNLESVLKQNYKNYRIIYINDCSTDDTLQCVEEEVKRRGIDYQVVLFDCSSDENDIHAATKKFKALVNQEKHFFTLVHNSKRSGSLANLYRAIHSSLDDEVIGIVDGDDWLWHRNVLQEINNMYARGDVWLTHGRFIEYPHGYSSWGMLIPEEIVRFNAFRKYRLPSHFRTFYSWLFKKIQLSDLMYQGDFYPMTGDMAMMFPMIEMAAERHVYNDKINYVYNMANQLNDSKVNASLQRILDLEIRKLSPYPRLEKKPLPPLSSEEISSSFTKSLSPSNPLLTEDKDTDDFFLSTSLKNP